MLLLTNAYLIILFIYPYIAFLLYKHVPKFQNSFFCGQRDTFNAKKVPTESRSFIFVLKTLSRTGV